MSFGSTDVYTVFGQNAHKSYCNCVCEFKKNLLSEFLGTYVFMPLLDLYDIDFHV